MPWYVIPIIQRMVNRILFIIQKSHHFILTWELVISPRQTWNHYHSLWNNQGKSHLLMVRICGNSLGILSSWYGIAIIIKGRKSSINLFFTEILRIILLDNLQKHNSSSSSKIVLSSMISWLCEHIFFKHYINKFFDNSVYTIIFPWSRNYVWKIWR